MLIFLPRSEITIWTFEGDIIHSLSAHASFVYSLTILPNGDAASGGEDRSLRIWRGIVSPPSPLGPHLIGLMSLRHRRGVPPDHNPSSHLSVVSVRDAQRRHRDRR
jgi:WD40 repeat protein